MFESLIRDHLVLQRNQQVLDCGGILPNLKQVKVLDAAVGLVDGWDVDLVAEGNVGRFFGILWSTLDLQTVDSIFESGLNEDVATL